jgi:hypothetical protein
MRKVLMNSAMIPSEGIYSALRVSKENFAKVFHKMEGSVISHIGYPQTAEILSQVLGIPVHVSRAATFLQYDDVMFVIKLQYRLQNPHEKAEKIHGNSINDYEFWIIEYFEDLRDIANKKDL